MLSKLNLFSVVQPLNKLEVLSHFDNLKCTISEFAVNSLSYFVLHNFVRPFSDSYFGQQRFFTISIPIINHIIRGVTGNECVPRLIFSFGNWFGFDTFIHELGHFIADKIVDPNSSVEIHDGLCSVNHLSIFTVGAGPAAAITSSTIKIVLANLSKNKFPRLSLYLGTSALWDISTHLVYAYSSQKPTCCRHDFEYLWDEGIHPAVAMIAMLSIPLLANALTSKH